MYLITNLKPYLDLKKLGKKTWKKTYLGGGGIMCHMSFVKCQVSHVTGHISSSLHPTQPHDKDIAQVPITLLDSPSPALPHSSVTKTGIPRITALLFTCHLCKKVFKERDDFNNHMTEVHNY